MSEILPQTKDFFFQTNKRGLVEMVDALSGKVISVQKDYNSDIIHGKKDDFIKYQLPDGEVVLAQRGLDMENYSTPVAAYKYNRVTADIICNKIMEGKLISKICSEEGMPNHATISRWKVAHPEFTEAIEMARKARAEMMHDKALEAVSDTNIENMTKDEVAAHKLKIDTYKWGAEKNDPAKFGKERSSLTGGGALQIVVNTGINRDNISDDELDQIINTTGVEVKEDASRKLP